MRKWWMTLSMQEQQAVMLGGIATGVILFFLLIWWPLVSTVSSMREQLISDQQLVLWMQQTKADILYLRGGSQEHGEEDLSLMALVDQTLKSNNVNAKIDQLQQTGTDQVKLTFARIPYDEMMTWLEVLAREYGVQVDRLHVATTPVTGVVQADMVLTK
jgi:general secretion pathway protein M